MSTCSYCRAPVNVKKQLESLRKEAKFWKDKSFIEKKAKYSMAQWVLGVFGFAVKVEVDKESLGLRVEGKENKDAIAQAIIHTGSDAIFLLEDRMGSEDFVEDAEELAALNIALAAAAADDQEEDGGETSQPAKSSAGVSNNETDNQQRDTQVIFDILRNCDNPDGSSGGGNTTTGGQQSSTSSSSSTPSFIFIKSDGHEGIQLDCSQLLQGDFNSNAGGGAGSTKNSTTTVNYIIPDNSQQHVVYRIASAPTTNNELMSSAADKTSYVLNSNTKGKPLKQYAPPHKKTKLTVAGQSSSSSNSQPPPPTTLLTSKVNEDKTTTPTTTEKLPSPEFGLTLRERAEIYVHSMAMKGIQKTSQGSYTCTECNFGYSFTSVENALTHTKTHFEGKPYKCNYCEETFAIQKEFLQHRKVHHSKKPTNSNTTTTSNNNNSFKVPLPPPPAKQLLTPTTTTPLTTTKKPVFLPPRNLPPMVRPPVVQTPTGSTTTKATTTTTPIKLSGESTNLSNKNLITFGQPGPANKNKQFKCQVPGCEWSYPNANELGWHIKAHSQSRV